MALALAAGPALAAAPYPQSTLITGITWDVGSSRWTASGADIWPITWAATDELVTAWGDGVVMCPEKVSYGVAAITSDVVPSTALERRHCGPGPMNKGKMMAILAVGSQQYARVNLQSTGTGYWVWKSGDGGVTWGKPLQPLSFQIASFVQFGKGNIGAPGGYVYALEERATAINLVRVPAGSVQVDSAYEYFSGTATAPAWSPNRSAARAIFTNDAGIQRPSITYVPGLGHYLLAVAHSLVVNPSSDKMGLFEAENMYGPWKTVYYDDNFLGMPGGHFLGMNFPIKWQAGDGKTLWATLLLSHPGHYGRVRRVP